MTIPLPPPVKTVSRFGISVSGNAGQGPMHQPKLKYRFRILMLGFGGPGQQTDAITLNTNTCKLPTLEHAEIPVHSYNSVAYVLGKHTWSPVTLTVRDTVDNTVVKAIGKQMQRQLDHYNQSGYRAGEDYKFTMQIQMLNGGYDSASVTWTGEGCEVTLYDPGEVDYSVSEGINVSLTIRGDNWMQEDQTGENSIFGAVPRDPLGNFIDS